MNDHVLLVDDDRALCETLETGLRGRGISITWRTEPEAALEALTTEDFGAVLTDLNMKGGGGIELCQKVLAMRPDMPVVVLTAFGSFESAVAAIRAGAYDFLSKPVKLDVLAIALRRALQHRALGDELKRLRTEVGAGRRVDALLGESAAMRKVHDVLARVASNDISVLVTGESGTGKEVLARAIHALSRRSAAPFVAVHCGAVPETLLEAELFGHTRGAFTDAKEARTGLFRQADGGTLLLDEIGDMPMSVQPKLLRVLQERKVRPVGGGATELPIDVRIIAATNRDLESAIEEGRFREDLFFRINVVNVALPPLRARGADVLLLAQHFLAQFAARTSKGVRAIAPSAAEKLAGYSWPGNVRELKSCIERAVTLARFDEITVDDLPDKVRDYKQAYLVVGGDDPSELAPLEEIERRYIQRVLEAVNGNKSVAARVLGIERKTLYRKLERFAGREAKE
ncbi:MAG TPA: sigma-54 dependent transcriptional regulator [Polyangiaceae bacterium]|jgi:two-component system response regulator HydG